MIASFVNHSHTPYPSTPLVLDAAPCPVYTAMFRDKYLVGECHYHEAKGPATDRYSSACQSANEGPQSVACSKFKYLLHSEY